MLTLVLPMSLEKPGLFNLGQSKRVNDKEFPYLVIGVGKESTQRVLAKWASDYSDSYDSDPGNDSILLLGFCGGLDPRLRSGDIVVSTHYCLDPGLLEGCLINQFEPNRDMFLKAINVVAEKNMGWSTAPSITTNRIVGNRIEKLKLRESSNTAAVNMEDFWVADFARQRGIPFLSVRVVIDEAAQEVSTHVADLQVASILPWKVLQLMLSRPKHLIQLGKLLIRLVFAKRKLGIFANAFLAAPSGFK
ncbi:MAG: hypothetical protein CM1200mP35_10030 [Chloroflexota bacterium]|nr:MAG: hypothetical protein CM1200mP35_10030 [Chloroflexota bacterium]